MARSGTALPESAPSLTPARTRAEETELALGELGTAAAGSALLWAGCVWLPLLGPVVWAIVGLFAFWRFAGMRRLHAMGFLDGPGVPYPLAHGYRMSIIEVSIAVPTILVTAAASVGWWTSVLPNIAALMQATLILATGGQLCVSAALASTVARREGVPALRVAARAALVLAPIGTLMVVPIAVQWLVGAGAAPAGIPRAIASSMTTIMLLLGAGGIAAALALRYALHGLSSIVPGGTGAPPRPRPPRPMPPPTPPEWAGDPDEPIPLVGDPDDVHQPPRASREDA
jgi:hypothetical protein